MAAHVRRVETLLSPTGLWDTGFQFGDWLDPDAPPDAARGTPRPTTASSPPPASTDPHRIVAETAELLGHADDAAEFRAVARPHPHGVQRALRRPTTASCGPTAPTVYTLAIVFGLLDEANRGRAPATGSQSSCAESGYRISTGFAGTPFITDALTPTGHLDDAYRLLLQRECPSWLYPVTMGATTVWERWDSMLPDGTINPGEMTSFNHYALGAVADWMHRTIGGIAPARTGLPRGADRAATRAVA